MYMYMNASVDLYFYIYKLVLVPNYEWKNPLNLNLILPTRFIFIDILWTSLFMFLIPTSWCISNSASDIVSTTGNKHLYPLNRPIAGVCYINGIKFSWNKAQPISRNVYAFCKLLSILNGFFSNPYRHILLYNN